MHYLDERHILLFLVQMALLLGLARALGLLFQRIGQPAITAEILVGVLLGPTVLGRLAPALYAALFPDAPVQRNMLETIAWLGIFFFLLQAGLHTDFGAAWAQRGRAARISFTDLTLPMVVAFAASLLLPDVYRGPETPRWLFALFIATILTISAMPVTIRALQELNIYRTDVGLLILAALTINDVAGWIVFAVVLGFATEGGMSWSQVPLLVAATLGFAAFCLSFGRRWTERAIAAFDRRGLPEPGASLTFICVLGLLGGAVTMWIGIHALFGFFIVGIMAGEAKSLSENTRQVISQMVRAVLVPLFFASIGLKLDFLARFDPFLVLFVLVIGVVGRFLGAWVGVTWAGHLRPSRHLISAAHVPGGEMQIVVGILALEYGVITEATYVAIIFGAVASSVILGPWMKWAISRMTRMDLLAFVPPGGIAADLRARTRRAAIGELCALAAPALPTFGTDDLVRAVVAREDTMGTGVGVGVAVPHARIEGLAQPVVVVGRSAGGIEWDAPDGQPAHLVFLVLTGTEDDAIQLRFLRDIAVAAHDPARRAALFDAEDAAALRAALAEALRTAAQGPAVPRQPAPAQDAGTPQPR